MVELETEAQDAREANMKAHRIMKNGGVTVLHTSAEKLEEKDINQDLYGDKFYGR